MPYKTNSELPKYLHKYSDVIQRQWRHVFTSVYERAIKAGMTKREAEMKAFRSSNSVLSRRFERKDGMIKNSREDFFSLQIDKFLNNIHR